MPAPALWSAPSQPHVCRITVTWMAEIGHDVYDVRVVTEGTKGVGAVSDEVRWPHGELGLLPPAVAAVVDAFIISERNDVPGRMLDQRHAHAAAMSASYGL